jgi:hypothetical protein
MVPLCLTGLTFHVTSCISCRAGGAGVWVVQGRWRRRVGRAGPVAQGCGSCRAGGETRASQACRAAFSSMPRPLRASTSTAPVSELRRKRSPATPASSAAFTVRGLGPSTVSFVPAVR